jgi:hypothetical protein
MMTEALVGLKFDSPTVDYPGPVKRAPPSRINWSANRQAGQQSAIVTLDNALRIVMT